MLPSADDRAILSQITVEWVTKRVWVMDVSAHMLVFFSEFRGPDRSFRPWISVQMTMVPLCADVLFLTG